jgi:metal-responsive CopG/Arc/MetJ family transcriptional regulator
MPAFLHWLHVYFDDDSCMEVTALKGSCGDVQQYFARSYYRERGVRYGRGNDPNLGQVEVPREGR